MPTSFALSTLSAVSCPIVRAIGLTLVHESDHNHMADCDGWTRTCPDGTSWRIMGFCSDSECQRTWANIEMAEREGFEPPIRLPVCRISSAVLSTTQPPLQVIEHAAFSSRWHELKNG